MAEREPHPLEIEGPLMVEVLQESLAVTQSVLAIATATAALRELADHPGMPEGLRAACAKAVAASVTMGWPSLLEASREIGSAAGAWFESIGGRFESGSFRGARDEGDPPE